MTETMACPDCLLTPLGWAMLRMELDRLRRDEPDGTWQAEVCQRCEQVTVIYDLMNGWSLGSRSTGPVRIVRTITRPAPVAPSPAEPEERPVVVAAPADRPGVAAGLGEAWAFATK